MIGSFGARLAADFPEVNAGSTWVPVELNGTAMSRSARAMVAMLIGLSAFVLLIACSNLANLLLARTMARAREFAVRAALGAARSQLLRPLIAESLLLALAGGAAAVVIAQWITDWLSLRTTGENGERVIFSLDWVVFGWAFGAALLTAVAFGLAPALFALRLNVAETLKSGGRGATGGRGHRRFRHALIVAQFALAMVLLTGAALYMRGFNDLNNTRSGWESERLLTGSIILPAATYNDPEKINTFHRVTLERLKAVPGVASVSISSFTPFFNWAGRAQISRRRPRAPAARPRARRRREQRQRRLFRDLQHTRSRRARFHRAGQSRRAESLHRQPEHRESALRRREPNRPAHRPHRHRRNAMGRDHRCRRGREIGHARSGPGHWQVYQPIAQDPRPFNEIALRTNGVAPATLVQSVRSVMAELDRDLPVRQLQPADTTIERANCPNRRSCATSSALSRCSALPSPR